MAPATGRRFLAALGLSAAAPLGAQMPTMQGVPMQGGGPSPNSLLNDLRAIQFPQGGGAPQGGAMPFGGGMPQQQPPQPGGMGGFGGLGGGMPQQQGGMGLGMGGQPGTPLYAGGGGGMGMAAPQGGMGGMPPPQGMGGMGMGMGGGMPMGGGGMPPPGMMGGGGVGMGGGMGGGAPGMPQAGGGGVEAPPDMACSSGPRAAGWMAAKRHFQSIFLGPGMSPLSLPSREVLTAALERALAELKAVNALSPQAADECGLGKLCLQLLSFATIDDPAVLAQLFQGLEQLASPVLTMMLDVPWAATGQAGWPLFGLLSTINLRKAHVPEALNTPEVDGLADVSGQTFLAELLGALQAGDAAALDRAGAGFLQRPDAQGSALAPLTALAAQALGGTDANQRLGFMQAMQGAMKQVIGSPGELDIALSTRWPLWGLLQMILEPFAM